MLRQLQAPTSREIGLKSNAYCARMQLWLRIRAILFSILSDFDAAPKGETLFRNTLFYLWDAAHISQRKRGDKMKKHDYLSTLFVGIDVSSKSNKVCAVDFEQNRLLTCSVANNQPGSEELAESLIKILSGNDNSSSGSKFKYVVIALEATASYSTHIATYLSDSQKLKPFGVLVYCLNPKTTHNYRKSFIGLPKNDYNDAYVIADFARVGRISQAHWRGSQFLALQRLTRHRLHITECITREKTYMVSNMFLKFSAMATDGSPFSNNYGATAEAVLTEFLSPDEIQAMPLADLVDYICQKGHGRFANPEATAKLLQKAARDSFRLDKCLGEPLTISIASSFNCISAFEKERKVIEKAIGNAIKGLYSNEYQCLTSIPGIGPVFAAGILAEIGNIADFKSNDSLAKYAGLFWKENQSGDYIADETKMSKEGNSFLRYYLIEAANSVKTHNALYYDYYTKKYKEATTHHHKRALALTARKLVRLIFVLLDKNQLFSDKVVNLN